MLTILSYEYDNVVQVSSEASYLWNSLARDDFLSHPDIINFLEKRKQSVIAYADKCLAHEIFRNIDELQNIIALTSPDSCIWLSDTELKALIEVMLFKPQQENLASFPSASNSFAKLELLIP